MNELAKQFPKPDGPTRLRLRACVAGFGMIGLAAIWRQRDFPAGLVVHLLSFLVLIWLAWIGTHRSPFLHRLWGGVCLVVSLALLAFGAVIAVRLIQGGLYPRPHQSPPSLVPLVLGAIPIPILAYLFLFDRRVSAFRRQLMDRDSHSSS